tara:strand:+ start:4019 stop:5908 length:1890 start_codon:yes stop_codon:yes gene_type:complete
MKTLPLQTLNMRSSLVLLILVDLALLSLSFLVAVYLQRQSNSLLFESSDFPILLALLLVIQVPLLYFYRLYNINLEFVGLKDLVNLVWSVILGTIIWSTVALAFKTFNVLDTLPVAALLLTFVFSLFTVGSSRIWKRIYIQLTSNSSKIGKQTLIVGAGTSGEELVRSLLGSSVDAGYTPVGFLDDDIKKQGIRVHGVPVIGTRHDLREIAIAKNISHLIIAMPSASADAIREIISLAQSTPISNIRILPALESLLSSSITAANLRELKPEDLLGRQVVAIDTENITQAFTAKRIMITGAGGSIGNELSKQILRFQPSELFILDHEETALFEIDKELNEHLERPCPIIPILEDIRNTQSITNILHKSKPDIIFHAAAYKHVEMLEHNPYSALSTNILGTMNLVTAAQDCGTSQFILISSDKAVYPTSFMGATKRFAEEICRSVNHASQMNLMAVRFGNVLGSRGSVIPIFQKQIAQGGPVTVRGKNVRRYFMSISEAALLVLQASSMGKGGEVFVLDMGNPIKIVDIARDLIRLSGMDPDHDIPIIFTELRSGEKEFEELFTAEEGTARTHHQKIHIAEHTSSISHDTIVDSISALEKFVHELSLEGCLTIMKDIVPSYEPSPMIRKKL